MSTAESRDFIQRYLEAISGIVLNDLTSAIKAYTQIVSLKPKEAQAYVDLGRAYEKNEEQNKALDNYLEATKLDPQYALAILRAGSLYGRQQKTPSALNALDKAQALYVALSHIEGQASVFYERAQLYISTGKHAEAGAQLQRAYDLAKASGNESQQINALLQQGRLAYIQGMPDKAQKFATEAIDFARQRGLDDLIALSLNELGYAFFVAGKYEEAEKNYNQAREFGRRNKSRLREAQVLRNLAILYIQQLRTDEGLAYAQQALKFFQEGGYHSYVSVCLTMIGRAHRRRGDYEEALRVFQQNLDMAAQSGYQPQVAFTQGEIAMVLTEQERYPEALSRYQQSYSINKSLNDQLGLMYNSLNLGNVQWRLGLYTDAQASLTQARGIAEQPGGYPPVLAEVRLRNAEIALSQQHYPEAKAESEQSLALAEKQYEWVYVQAKLALGLAQAHLGAAPSGKILCEEAVEIAKRGGDYALVSKALLALAEVLLEGNDARGALSAALEAKDRFSRASQQESEWRARTIAALAYRRQGNEDAAREELAQATAVLSQLHQKWGDETFAVYLNRRDTQFFHKQLGGSPVIAAGN